MEILTFLSRSLYLHRFLHTGTIKDHFIGFSDANKHIIFNDIIIHSIHSCICFNKRICITFTISVLLENYLRLVSSILCSLLFFFFHSTIMKNTNRMNVFGFYFSLWSTSRAVKCKGEDYFSWQFRHIRGTL